jgi:hypothetical protein
VTEGSRNLLGPGLEIFVEHSDGWRVEPGKEGEILDVVDLCVEVGKLDDVAGRVRDLPT